MDAVSYANSAKQAKRIKKFIENPDSDSGIVTTPKVIQSGETITIPDGRMAVLPDLTIEGDLVLEGTGDVFIPAGSTLTGTVTLDTAQTITGPKEFMQSPKVPDGVEPTDVVNKGQLDEVSIPTGLIIANPSITIPAGFLECNGASLSKTTYANLFAVIGTTYGSTSTTFKLPDLRGEFIRGFDNGRGVDIGRTIGTSQGDAIRNITGTLNLNNADVQSASGALSKGSSNNLYAGANSNGLNSETINFNASSVVPVANENRPRNIAMMYCIKY